MNDSPDRDMQSIEELAARVAAKRPIGQVLSIANQLDELLGFESTEDAPTFDRHMPVSIGVSGGRLRIAFMHPDMARFFGPALQSPIGAKDGDGREQIVVLMQSADEGKIEFSPNNAAYREQRNWIAADAEYMFPDADVIDLLRYEAFGTQMAETILAELGYATNEQIAGLIEQGEDCPQESSWVINSMRRPFPLLANAIAAIRTLRNGETGQRVQANLGRSSFKGLKAISTGDIPCGGFSSSSAVTVASQNAINALYNLQLNPDQIVELACKSEYGTGVRAGALDQATEQMGSADHGALISSNPRDNYHIIKKFPVDRDRYRILFPYSVDRDREAWKWSMNLYAGAEDDRRLTASETRKMTGKASEIAAVLLGLQFDRDFFSDIEEELVEGGELFTSTASHVQDSLKSLPILATKSELQEQLRDRQPWYASQLRTHRGLSERDAERLATSTMNLLLNGWRDPLLTRSVSGCLVDELGAPLRAMVGYLYAEVTKNCYLVHHPDEWIRCVTASQRGDRCFDISLDRLPDKDAMMSTMPWERSTSRMDLMRRWLERFKATHFDFNADLDDRSLSLETPRCLREIRGTNFFRGLPLIDLAEAMLKRAFGEDAVAVRVNGAGQGDYFQVHVDVQQADPSEVKYFIREAFYRRFSLPRNKDFVEPYPGGGAVGVRLPQYSQLPALVRALRRHAEKHCRSDSADALISKPPEIA